jgi:signal transduction histidine kinase/ligand-binding sensor domain-containing protein
MRACLLWLVLMLASPCGLAIDAARGIHQLQHSSWTAREGAPDDISVMTQGNDGYLWLGTHAGPMRFDGLRFESVAARQGRYPDTVVLSLQRARDGGMWLGWQVGGISHVKDGVVRNFGEAQGLRIGTVWGFATDGAGVLWAAGASGVARFDGRRWQTLGAAQGFTASKASAVFADRDGRLGVFSEQGLFLWQPEQGRFAPPIGKLDLRAPQQQGPDGRLYLLEQRGIRIIDSLERYDQLEHRWIYRDTSGTSGSMLVDSQGTLWFDSQHGLHRTRSAGVLGPRQLGISSDTQSFLPQDGLSNALIGSLCEDNEGNIWVATYAGLDRFRQAAPVLLRTRAGAGEPEAFRAQEVLAGSGGAMWLAGEESLSLMLASPEGTLLRDFTLPPVSGMLLSRQGVWVAVPGGLRHIDPVSGRVLRSLAYPPEARAIGRMRQMASAPDGSMWANFSGVGVFQYRDGQWRRDPALSGDAARNPLALLVDAAGRLWLSYADGGVAMLDKERLHRYAPQVGKAPALFDDAGRVWVGGEHGVAVWREGRFTSLRSSNPAAFDGVVGMLRARDGSLWLNTANGAVHVAANEVAQALREPSFPLRARIYDAVDGVTGKISMLHKQSLAEADDGRIWFSRQSVTFWIDPRQPPATLPAARVEIGAMAVDGVDAKAFQGRLPAGTRDLQFNYNASSLGTPSRLQFHCLLEGYDQHWHSAGSRRQVQYTGLGPGHYVFKVMAFNGDGVASAVAQLPFQVLPAFYQTWWFRALCAVALLAALYAAFRWRVRRHGARLQARLEAQQAERERIARELHDTLLQGTQAVILHFHNASMALPADEPARTGMLRALDAADRMLAEGRDHVQELRAGAAGDGDQEGWSAMLQREGEHLATLHGVAFRYIESGTPRALQAATSHEICRIASEALRNAFAHARAELIELEVRHARGCVQVDVRDDGLGLPPAVAASGQLAGHWGLPGMRERAAALGAELALLPREGGGTHWRLRVPGTWQQRWLLRWKLRRDRARSGAEDAAP